MSTLTAPSAERRSVEEPQLTVSSPVDAFPELKSVPEGAMRANAAIRMVMKDFFSDTPIKLALTQKPVRPSRGISGEAAKAHYYILAKSGEATDSAGQPAIDGQALFQRYVNGDAIQVEDVKDVLFAIRREAKKLENAPIQKFQRLEQLASLAIYDFQQQRRRDIGI